MFLKLLTTACLIVALILMICGIEKYQKLRQRDFLCIPGGLYISAAKNIVLIITAILIVNLFTTYIISDLV